MSREQASSTKEEIGVGKPISLFDVDGTLTDGFAIVSFAEYLNSNGEFSDANLTAVLADFAAYKTSDKSSGVYHAFAEQIVDHYAEGLAGSEVMHIQDLAEGFFDKVVAGEIQHYTLFPFTNELLQIMNQFGPTIAISGSPIDALRPLKKHVGMADVYGTTFQNMGGVYTGEIDTNLAVGTAKKDQVGSLIGSGNFDLSRSFAFGDSMPDVPLLAAVKNPFVLGTNKELREEGRLRGWNVVDDPSRVLEMVRAKVEQVFHK